MKQYYAVIDTNVIVSATIRWKSVPGSIVDLTFSNVIVPVLNEEILTEYREVLLRPKFKLSEDIVDGIVGGICKNAVFVNADILYIELPDLKDRVFYEVTMEGRKTKNTYLITGNTRHFPAEPFIVTPREMLDIVLEEMDYEE